MHFIVIPAKAGIQVLKLIFSGFPLKLTPVPASAGINCSRAGNDNFGVFSYAYIVSALIFISLTSS